MACLVDEAEEFKKIGLYINNLGNYLNYRYSIDVMVTTIQLNETVKRDLDRFRNGKETYESIILGLMKMVESYKINQEQLMKEGYEEMAEENLKIEKEFELVEDSRDWEW